MAKTGATEVDIWASGIVYSVLLGFTRSRVKRAKPERWWCLA